MNSSQAVVWLLALFPGVMAFGFLSAPDFDNPSAVLNTLGRLTGIWGMALLLIAAALCCRVPGFDRPFGGLTKLWKLHHRLGAVAFLLLLSHPLLLAFSAAGTSLSAAVGTLFSARPAVIWGWVALLALMIFMAPSFRFFGEPEYQRWKHLHRLAGITVVLGLVHTLLLSRTLPGVWGPAVWGLWAALAIGAIGYRWGFSRWHGRLPYRVVAIDRPARNVVELALEPQAQVLCYEPGQFVYLTPYDTQLPVGRGEEHPYTVSSAPDETGLRIAIKNLGDASRALQTVRLDSEVRIEGPYGCFFPSPDAPPEPELWIAGGIGITPFLSRLRHCARRGQVLRIHLIYCVQDETRVLFEEELAQLMAQLPESRVTLHFFYREGPLRGEFIEHACPDAARRSAYLCGPLPLIERASTALQALGVPQKRIVTEEFVLL
ncbi:ferredoxin reductase family protein [Marinimicrobium agarilyticum]|uniref:ferredoxin reductase family protein n=1 Tax=Marinimicrobium agarilyticum TaxID=306546 RepID=UPI00146E5B57|nr:ferric reductase-like transmembrane domain-containing protein [Marinimicrobium agarilyticum]